MVGLVIVVVIIVDLLKSTSNSYWGIPIIIYLKIFSIFLLMMYIMWQFLCGFGAGVYVGTVYDCKPSLIFVRKCIKNFIPEEAIPKKKDDDNSE
jgi:hypothetical protein